MTTEPKLADTRSMGIVHSALRRDLERTRIVLSTEPYPNQKRRREIAKHVAWMMHFLHVHHAGEDNGLWPLVRTKNPAAGELLDEMDADHRRIAPAITAVEAAAQAYLDNESAREQLLAALAGLAEVLLAHLRREELEMMPIVSASITTEEYHQVEQEHFVNPKHFTELGVEGHWMIDGVSAEDRDLVLHMVPAVPRFILLHGFAGIYRRKRDLLWGDSPAAAVPSLNLAYLDGAV